MKWLVVLGEGDWLAEKGVRFKPGKHEVSDEVAIKAKTSGITRLLVLDNEPEIVWKDSETDGPLQPEHIQRGSPRGVSLAVVEGEGLALPDDDGPPKDFHCLHCTDDFRTQAALDRHIEFHHTDT